MTLDVASLYIEERVVSNLARCVLTIWFLVVLILTQSYTVSFASMLTVQKLLSKVKDVSELIKTNENVRYMQGSFVLEFLKNTKVDESRLNEYNSMGQLDEYLSKGSKNGGDHNRASGKREVESHKGATAMKQVNE